MREGFGGMGGGERKKRWTEDRKELKRREKESGRKEEIRIGESGEWSVQVLHLAEEVLAPIDELAGCWEFVEIDAGECGIGFGCCCCRRHFQ